MKTGIIITALLLVFGPLSAGTIKDMTGKVDVLTGGSWQKASLSMEIKDGDKIMTGISSRVRVETEDGFFEVNELSMVTFKDMNMAGTHDQKLAVQTGKVKVRFTKIQGSPSSFKVQTPSGTASVLGTEENVGYKSYRGMTVFVIDGHVLISDNHGNGFEAGHGEQGGVSGDHKFYGNFDNNYGGLNQNDQFGDNDIGNHNLNGGFKGPLFYPPKGSGPSQPTTEPERL